jgi:CBS domain-containing protein
MQVKDIMTESPAYALPVTNIGVVARLMVEHDCGCIPIVESEEARNPVGMLTDRDIVVRSVAANQNPLLLLLAGDIMTGDVVTVTPETRVEECANLMESKQIRRVALVDENNRLCGMVAQADVAVSAPTETTADLLQEVSRSADG